MTQGAFPSSLEDFVTSVLWAFQTLDHRLPNVVGRSSRRSVCRLGDSSVSQLPESRLLM